MKFDIVTIFPRMVEALLLEGLIARAVERKLLDVLVHDLRTFTTDRHRSVDDVPYGGGPGMVMKPEPFIRAAQHLRRHRRGVGERRDRSRPVQELRLVRLDHSDVAEVDQQRVAEEQPPA